MQTEKYIRNLLEQLNNGKLTRSYLVTRKLSETVKLARIWKMDEALSHIPVEIYLLVADGKYTGAVMEQDSEIFAYTSPSFRRKGLMKTCLKDTVLPHLLQRKPILRATLERSLLSDRMYMATKRLAASAGFEILSEQNGRCKLLLDGTVLQKRIYIAGINEPLSKDRRAEMKNFLAKITLFLSIVQANFEMTEGRSPLSEDLLDLLSVTKKIFSKI
jgi:hypothetical protein